MKSPENHKGYLKVFPNFRHQTRKDGFGCAQLSPMNLGPVHHGQPGLSPALNIENFHQGSKCFQQEVGPDGNPSTLFYENQQRFFEDPEPYRHKYKGKEKNKNIPLYFVWIDQNGQEHHLTYVESRQFYCTFYELLATAREDFLTLKEYLKRGYNLQICGYDGRPVETNDFEREYLDASKPFGHELVLAALLTVSPATYPWRSSKVKECFVRNEKN